MLPAGFWAKNAHKGERNWKDGLPTAKYWQLGLTGSAWIIAWSVKTGIWQYWDALCILSTPRSLIPLCSHPCTAIPSLTALELVTLSWWVPAQPYRTCRHTGWDSGASVASVSSCTRSLWYPGCPHEAGERGHDDTHLTLSWQLEAGQKSSTPQMALDNSTYVTE